MKPDSPQSPREEMEARLTALLLGELTPAEAAAVQRAIEQDAELARLHDRLRLAVELVREAAAEPSEQLPSEPERFQLSEERRQKLLQQFKTVAPREFAAPRRWEMPWYVPIGIAATLVLLVGGAALLPRLASHKALAQLTAIPGRLEDGVESYQLNFAKTSARRIKQDSDTTDDVAVSGLGTDRFLAIAPLETPALRPPPRPETPPASPIPAGTKPEEHSIVLPDTTVAAGTIVLYDMNRTAVDEPKSRVVEGMARPSIDGFAGGVTGSGGPQRLASDKRASSQQVGAEADSESQIIPTPALGKIVLGDGSTQRPIPGGLRPQNTSAIQSGPRDAGKNENLIAEASDAKYIGVLNANAVGDANVQAGQSKTRAGAELAGLSSTNSIKANFAEEPAEFTKKLDKDALRVSREAVDTRKLAEAELLNRAAGTSGSVDSVTSFGYLNVPAAGPQVAIVLPPAQSESEEGRVVGESSAGRMAVTDLNHSSPEAKPAVDATPASDESARLARQLGDLQSSRDKLVTRIWQEKIDLAMPRSSVVEIIDAAEAQPAKSPTLLERLGESLSSQVERHARVSVQKDPTDIAGLSSQTVSSAPFVPHWAQTESERIQSKPVLEKVVEKLKLNEAWAGKDVKGQQLSPEATIQLLKKKINVRQESNSGLIDIGVKSDSPDEAARIANTIAEVYRDDIVSRWKQMDSLGIIALEKHLDDQEKKIALVKEESDRLGKESKRQQEDASPPKPAAPAPVPQPEVLTRDNTFSTFSLNVSDVSFKLAAAALEKGAMPEPATVRSEEFINAFDYRDPEPAPGAPVAFAWERARYPFAHNRDLLRLSLKTAASGRQSGRPLNLVLLLDNSGSMERADRVRIIQECLRVLAAQLQPQDRVSVVAFARTARLWVDGLPGSQAGELGQRVGNLTPQGGTNLEDAMNLAYQAALRHYLPNGINRVVLLTDGAANLGDVEPESLKQKVEAHRQQGVALDCFGIGWEGYNDDLLEVLSRNGDGRYGFVNTPEEASTGFAGQLAGALQVAASDVKVQVEFNPSRVIAYRQIGYARHQLQKEQFRDNTVDAAEIGAAEAGNALYVVQVDPRGEGPLGVVRVRYKVSGTADYREHEWALPFSGEAGPLEQASPAMRLAASASAFSEWLVSSPFASEVTPDRLLGFLNGVPEVFGADPRPKKLEGMLRQAKAITGK